MFDYTALISLVGFVALGFVPLYIPTVVTVVGGIRRWRENFRQQAVSQHATQAAEPSSHSPRTVTTVPPTVATKSVVTDRVLPMPHGWPLSPSEHLLSPAIPLELVLDRIED
jgi:hypothetical protein